MYLPNTTEAIFLYFVIFSCMNTLTMLFFHIKELRVVKPLHEYIKSSRGKLEQVISKIERRGLTHLKKRQNFDTVLNHALQQFIYSTAATFNVLYFKELPPRLRTKLIYAT